MSDCKVYFCDCDGKAKIFNSGGSLYLSLHDNRLPLYQDEEDIKLIEKAIEEYRGKSQKPTNQNFRWISVEENLPKYDRTVAIAAKGMFEDSEEYTISLGVLDYEDGWITDNNEVDVMYWSEIELPND